MSNRIETSPVWLNGLSMFVYSVNARSSVRFRFRTFSIQASRQKKSSPPITDSNFSDMRLKVPPSLAQFQNTLDRNTAAQTFKLLGKYRPEAAAEKKERLSKEASAIASGKTKEDASSKPYTVKYGLNHVVGLVENKKASLVLIPNDVDPIELVSDIAKLIVDIHSSCA